MNFCNGIGMKALESCNHLCHTSFRSSLFSSATILVLCMATTATDHLLHASGHALIQFLDITDRDVSPDFLHSLPQLVQVPWSLLVLIKLSFQIRPEVLGRIEVWRV